MTTDEIARVHDICCLIRKTLIKIESADHMHDVANMCTWAVADIMMIQKLAAHRARIIHTDLQRRANK
jgi:hypothetical protein